MKYAINSNYELRHVDQETGFGILYSSKEEKCIFLNPFSVEIWKKPEYLEELITESRLYQGGEKNHLYNYIQEVIADLIKRSLLFSSDSSDNKSLSNGFNKHPQETDILHPPLKQIYFYATRNCNARCYHCYQPTIKVPNKYGLHQPKQISKESFVNLIKEAIPLGLEHVKITGGEPLLREDIGDVISAVRKMGLIVSMETNGFLIDDSVTQMLVENEVSVSISLDGGSAAIHDALRGHPGSFDRTINALTVLSSKGLNPQVICSISRKNLQEVENVIKVTSSTGCRLIKLNPVNTLGIAQKLKHKDILLEVTEILDFYSRRKELEEKYGVFLFLEGPLAFATIKDAVDGHSAICPFTEILGILSDGSISFCGIGNSYPELVFGNIDNDKFDIKEFWQKSKTLIQMRGELTRKINGVCENCILEPHCKGSCRALAYGEFRSFLAPHPWCQSAFDEGVFPQYYLKQNN